MNKNVVKIKKGQVWVSKTDSTQRLKAANKKGENWRMVKLDTGHNTHEMSEFVLRKHYEPENTPAE
jgi:hypothetical protein